jgi:hypothetical protein
VLAALRCESRRPRFDKCARRRRVVVKLRRFRACADQAVCCAVGWRPRRRWYSAHEHAWTDQHTRTLTRTLAPTYMHTKTHSHTHTHTYLHAHAYAHAHSHARTALQGYRRRAPVSVKLWSAGTSTRHARAQCEGRGFPRPLTAHNAGTKHSLARAHTHTHRRIRAHTSCANNVHKRRHVQVQREPFPNAAVQWSD